MGTNFKSLIIFLPFVIGSYIIPGGYLANSKFREYREIELVITDYVENEQNGVKFNSCQDKPSTCDKSSKLRNKLYKEKINRKYTARNSERYKHKIVIYDVNDNIATARLTSDFGVEYLHLIKIHNNWSICNTL